MYLHFELSRYNKQETNKSQQPISVHIVDHIFGTSGDANQTEVRLF